MLNRNPFLTYQNIFQQGPLSNKIADRKGKVLRILKSHSYKMITKAQ